MNSFESFWQAYPRKVGKGAAEKAFNKLKPDAELLEKMKLALQAQAIYRREAQKAGTFLPDWCHPSTWLNGQRWLDEIPSHHDLKEKSQPAEKTCRCGKPATHKGKETWVCAKCWYDDWHDEPRVLHYSLLRKAEFKKLGVVKETTWRAACLPVIWSINPGLAKLLGR